MAHHMVDINQIQQLLKKHFEIIGKATVDPVTGAVDVEGNVSLETPHINQLPVQFGQVSGHFWCHDKQLTSLVNAPTHVGVDFWCHNNQLTSLKHAPTHVGFNFLCSDNPLTTLEHAPAYVGRNFVCGGSNTLTNLEHAPAPAQVKGTVYYTWNEETPLLRLLVYKRLVIEKSPKRVKEIMKQYKGKGKAAALACAAELLRAGFKENARW